MAVYPLPAFHFQVDWGSSTTSFSEVSGLNSEADLIEYRHGDSPQFSTIKYPGMQKFGNVTLKRGIVPGDNEFFDWLNSVANQRNVTRRDITIKLLDETGNPTMVWNLSQCWPIKYEGAGLKSVGSEVAVESMELAFENLTASNGS